MTEAINEVPNKVATKKPKSMAKNPVRKVIRTTKKVTAKKRAKKKTAKKPVAVAEPQGNVSVPYLQSGTPMTEVLGESFLTDLIADWQESGTDVIEECRTNKPDAYLRLIAAYAPKEFRKQIQPFEEVSDENLEERLKGLLDELKAFDFDRDNRVSNGEETSDR